MEYFDAASGAGRPMPDLLADLQRAARGARLLELLDEVDETCDRLLEEEADEPLDESLVALLEQVTGAHDAPPHFTLVHERVRHGLTTWARFWQRPTDEYRGYEIIQAAIAATARDVERDLATVSPKENRD